MTVGTYLRLYESDMRSKEAIVEIKMRESEM